MTTAQLQTLRDALVTALSKGLLEVTSGDKTLRYQSSSEMIKAIAQFDREIAVSSGAAVVRSITVQHSRG